MDDLTFRSGIDAQGRKIHGGAELPNQGERHQNRMLRACATMAPAPGPLTVEELEAEDDGRKAYPLVVQYRILRLVAAAQEYVPAEVVDLPPLEPESHYEVIVHDLAAYDRLKATGALDVGHRVLASAPADRPTTHSA
jgi:hypothetical protein